MTGHLGSRGKCGIGLVGVGVLCVILAGCGGGGNGAISSYSAVGSSSPAGGSPGGVAYPTLTWDAPNQNMGGACINVATYQIHFGTSSTNLSQTISLPAGSVTCTNSSTTNACGPVQSCTYAAKNPPSGTWTSGTWYFAVQVVDGSGQQSGYSGVVSDLIN